MISNKRPSEAELEQLEAKIDLRSRLEKSIQNKVTSLMTPRENKTADIMNLKTCTSKDQINMTQTEGFTRINKTAKLIEKEKNRVERF